MAHINNASQTQLADELHHSYLSFVVDQIQQTSLIHFGLLGLTAWCAAQYFSSPFDRVKAPLVGRRSVFEPFFLLRLRFALGALAQVQEGYHKYKDRLFRVCRNDRDVVVIPQKYVDELQNLPGDVLSSTEAIYANHAGRYAGLSIILESQLHSTTLQSRLTPSIPKFISAMENELLVALPTIIPECEDHWVEINTYDVLLNLVSRATNRVLLGEPDCYNEEWARASMNYAGNVTLTIGIMRLFPLAMRPLAARFVPAICNVQTNLRLAKKALVPIIDQRREAEKSSADYQKPDDFLQWLMDAAVGDDGQSEKLAHRQLITFLAAAHTSTQAGTHACYDLAAMPEYVEPLRDEISGLLNQDGGWGPNTPSKMRKMDSFLRESQRVNPQAILDFHRIVQKPLTLSDGLHLPAGTHICAASYSVSQDPENIPNAQNFDGFRYYHLRKQPGEDNKHQFAMTDKNHLHFGRGKYACPGRFFASAELKMIIAHLILRYDFKYPEGKGRPANLNADEFLYPDPAARLLIRRRPRA